MKRQRPNVLPGFRPALSWTLFYLSLIVLLPIGTLAGKAIGLSFQDWIRELTNPQVWAAFRLTFGAAFFAAIMNGIFGFIVAWCLARYSFPGRRILDALVDLPFALPTAVAGIALTAAYAHSGFPGAILAKMGIEVAYTPIGVALAMTYVGLPFVVRTLEPVVAELDLEVEEAAACLGANRWTTFLRVILPALRPAWIAGTTQAFARALGEYGSVIFIAGNLPFKTEILPLLIVTRLERFDFAGATVLASAMLTFSLVLFLAIQWMQGSNRPGTGVDP